MTRREDATKGGGGLVVLGMHRSGTSALTGLLSLCGAWVGEAGELTSANIENPMGFFERRDLRGICDRLLEAGGAEWWKISSFDIGNIPHATLKAERQNFAKLLNALEKHPEWVIKEPRLCLLLPAVRDYLQQAVYVLVTRDPVETARSMQLRNGFTLSGCIALWESYNRQALSATVGHRRVFVEHRHLMQNPVESMARVLTQLRELGVEGLSFPETEAVREFIKVDLYRQRISDGSSELFLTPEQTALWQELRDGGRESSLSTRDINVVTRQSLRDLESAELSMQQIAGEGDARVAKLQMQKNQLRRRLSLYGRKLKRQTALIGKEKALREEEKTLHEKEKALHEEERVLRKEDGKRIRYLEQELRRRDRTIEGLHNSFSWRVTLPFRMLRRQRDRARRALSRRGGSGKRPIAKSRDGSSGPEARLTPEKDSSTAARQTQNVAARMRELATSVRSHGNAAEAPLGALGTGSEGGRPKVSVITWCCAHNPLGRAYLLADMLSRELEVEVIGACFPSFGEEVWEPLRSNGRVTIKSFPGCNFPEHFSRMEDVVSEIDGDILYVSKARLPSIALGILAKEARNRPLLLDVDDYELGFFKNRCPLTLDEVNKLGGNASLEAPYQETWTRYAAGLIPLFDRLTVATPELKAEYGGTVIPHGRDERAFKPFLYPRERARQVLGFGSDDKVVVFLGTPREHKGVVQVADAVLNLAAEGFKFLIVGLPSERNLRRYLANLDPHVATVLPNVPFEEVPAYLRAGDLVCLLQDPSSAIARFQMPAKFTDALAMGLPILGTSAAPLARVAHDGVLQILDEGPLAPQLQRAFMDVGELRERGVRNREHFLQLYSYSSVLPRLMEVLESARKGTSPMRDEFAELVAFHRRRRGNRRGRKRTVLRTVVVGRARGSSALREGEETKSEAISYIDDKLDIVFFWKQNDSGIYGRRQDMLTKYLGRAPGVNMVLHFDEPVAARELFGLCRRWRRNGHFSQDGLVALNILRRVFGYRSAGKVWGRTYLYFTRRRGVGRVRSHLPSEEGYLDYIARTMRAQGLGKRRLIFWVCPRNFHFPEIAARFKPDLIVADVIDDHRRWPGISGAYMERLSRNYEEIVGRSDVVLANCDRVQKAMMTYTGSVHVVPNGLEVPDFDGTSGRKPRQFRRIEGPIVGYVGNLDGARLDLQLLERVAIARPTWNLVFIGSMHRGSEVRALERYPNVHLLGAMNYERALMCMRQFDVAMVPHLDSELTRHMSPLKVYVYLALRLPVVSTDIAHLEDFGELVCRTRTSQEFVSGIESSLACDFYAGKEHAWREFVDKNGWEHRVRDVLALVEERLRVRKDRSAVWT